MKVQCVTNRLNDEGEKGEGMKRGRGGDEEGRGGDEEGKGRG